MLNKVKTLILEMQTELLITSTFFNLPHPKQ